jgi:hypothetical protein
MLNAICTFISSQSASRLSTLGPAVSWLLKVHLNEPLMLKTAQPPAGSRAKTGCHWIALHSPKKRPSGLDQSGTDAPITRKWCGLSGRGFGKALHFGAIQPRGPQKG